MQGQASRTKTYMKHGEVTKVLKYESQIIKLPNLFIIINLVRTSLTFLFITSQARRERNPPATDVNCTIRVATARGRFPQYAEMLSGLYTIGKASLLSSTWRTTNHKDLLNDHCLSEQAPKAD